MHQSTNVLNLKEFFKIPETSKKLSQDLDTDISQADVIRFALDGRLPLAVYSSDMQVRHGKIIPYEKTKWIEGNFFLKLLGYPYYSGEYGMSRQGEVLPIEPDQGLFKINIGNMDHKEKPEFGMRSHILVTYLLDENLHTKILKPNFISFCWKPDEGEFSEIIRERVGADCTVQFLDFRNTHHGYIKGLWDFTLSEGNFRVLENIYFQLFSDAKLTPRAIPAGLDRSIYVEREGEICLLTSSSPATDKGATTLNTKEAIDALMAEYGDSPELDRQFYEFFDLQYDCPESPANELPPECILVVRTQALMDFVKQFNEKTFVEMKKETAQQYFGEQPLPDDGRPKLSGIIAICKFYIVDIKIKDFPTDKKAKDFNEWKTINNKLKTAGFLRYNNRTPWTTPLAMEKLFFE